MLVLTRKSDEKVYLKSPDLKETIIITIVRVDGKKVSIGVTASEDAHIVREELSTNTQKKVKR